MATAGIFIEDINQDDHPDVIAIGSHTHNVVLYENLGASD